MRKIDIRKSADCEAQIYHNCDREMYLGTHAPSRGITYGQGYIGLL